MQTGYFEPSRPRVLAHRGLALEAPENTLLAFAKAVGIGCRYIETDVHVSRDGIAVVAHDPSLERVANRDVAVGKLTMAELRRIDLGHGQAFCALDEALDAFPETRFNIDVKVEGAVDAAVAAVSRASATARVLLTSFSDRRRLRLAALLPGVATSTGSAGVVRARLAGFTGSGQLLTRVLRGAHAMQIPERAGPLRLVTAAFVDAAHRVGAEVHVWTVNEASDMRRLLDLGVDGLVTDRADVALPLTAAPN
ncbi:glycerophosphodiester phosphodiesterase family protein [Agromyces ramosus]|uniref:Glycerophosphoryl diester phosphodiesterase n=1 Tax=Agromyces ramosus TaxID=33879 RepID=A0ABU0RDB5_9MICO|nr:glycerophosphodiester phosphodiesterase family protein [Agromyces ramosus]MDQ0896068.1 glycerophosphoryl diester phosphodiesterase [Agromyces ramosus]